MLSDSSAISVPAREKHEAPPASVIATQGINFCSSHIPRSAALELHVAIAFAAVDDESNDAPRRVTLEPDGAATRAEVVTICTHQTQRAAAEVPYDERCIAHRYGVRREQLVAIVIANIVGVVHRLLFVDNARRGASAIYE